VHETSLISAGEPEADMAPVLSGLIDPLLETCARSADGLDPSDAAVFMLNNSTKAWVHKLGDEMDTWLGVLVRHQADKVLERCGLAPAIRASEAAAGKEGPACAQPGLDETTLATVLRHFYSSLFSLVMPDFERIRRPGVRADARRTTSLLVAEAHEGIYALAADEASGYEDKSFLLHTPEQVRMLLDCD
ncbi:unnamed protein product, partial [Discosporangium mesarthrocarpum]